MLFNLTTKMFVHRLSSSRFIFFVLLVAKYSHKVEGLIAIKPGSYDVLKMNRTDFCSLGDKIMKNNTSVSIYFKLT